MIIKSIRLLNFRNYEQVNIEFPKMIHVLYGKNGQGKTNLLEALYMIGTSKSYKGIHDQDLINWHQISGSIIVHCIRNDVEQEVKIILSRVQKKELWINNTKYSSKDFFGFVNEVLFSPDDLQLIKGTPSLRRHFIDMEISQANAVYYKDLLQYNRVLSQRNFILKELKSGKHISLEEWDKQLAILAAKLVRKRKEVIYKINVLAGMIQHRLTKKESIHLVYYQPYVLTKEAQEADILYAKWYYEALKANVKEDIYKTYTSIGPHRDDFIVHINGQEAKKYASQGQQRTAILSLKLSELEFIKSETGEYPILLLDDVMSELDEQRRLALIKFVRNRIQTFITTTDPFLFSSMSDCYYLGIHQGRVLHYGEKAE
ncbi:DNA replication/repair protein RecF [Megasphaera hutchinsoni]|uniref:DNA replication and repair protein RecF n=1 Tax=Megasphaera hutchinsoni TaxID=1588748 RepID=A0A134CEB6_9FIRM|nr:DNA replication/repair protein RecF [Megasphaera hutchinsoni]KXB90510.1 putative DNA replication and repair protein RecF [Megasphaera hutchinsoni]